MATTTDIREWARQQGLTAKAKGPLPDDVRAAYAEAHPEGGTVYPLQPDPGPEEVTTAAPPPAPDPDPRQAERTPARPRRSPSAGGRRVAGWFARKPAGKKGPARKIPRVPIASLIEDAWGQMAFAASPLPPMQRLLQAQAPFAGIALEDALAGTVVDRVLQPVARAEDKAKAVGGLMFPPMALMLVMATAPVPQQVGEDPEGNPVFTFPEPSTQHKGAIMTLRWSLMLWSEAGAARLEEYSQRAEAAAERGAQADKFMAWILGYEEPGPPAEVGGDDPAVNAEDEAIRRAQEMFGG